MGFSSSNIYPSVLMVSYPAGQTPTSALVFPGLGPYTVVDRNIFGLHLTRWGDYFAAAPAGLGKGFSNLWFAGQYAGTDPHKWNTLIGQTDQAGIVAAASR
jgi:hypothetical protein